MSFHSVHCLLIDQFNVEFDEFKIKKADCLMYVSRILRGLLLLHQHQRVPKPTPILIAVSYDFQCTSQSHRTCDCVFLLYAAGTQTSLE